MAIIRLEAGSSIEDIISNITSNLNDSMLDEIEIHRDMAKPGALASEPITVAVTIMCSNAMLYHIFRLIEQYMENKRQIENLRIVANGFSHSDEAGRQLALIAQKHAKISVIYGLSNISSEDS